MPLLASEITIDLPGESVTLTPSLRLAFQVFRQHNLQGLVKSISEGSLTVAFDLIEPHTGLPLLERHLIEAGLDRLAVPLLEYVMALAGIDPASTPKQPGKGKPKPVDPEENLTELYRIGTGWLGWTPEGTLSAAPAEIIEAHRGRVAMLQAIFGGGKEKKKSGTDGMSVNDKFRFAFAELGATRAEQE